MRNGKNPRTTTNIIVPTIIFPDVNRVYVPLSDPISSFTLAPITNSDGVFVFSSYDSKIISIKGNIATIYSSGSTIISATQLASGNFAEVTVYSRVTVEKANMQLFIKTFMKFIF
jgi:hypothetical protein